MPGRFLIIDGYNLMHACGMAQQDYAQGDLQRCRNRLLKFLLERLTSTEVARGVVIFDARDPPVGFPSQYKVGGLRVVFANPGGDADILIEQLIATHSAPRQVCLVSGDRRLQTAARKRRAAFVDSDAFCDELNQRPVSQQRTQPPAAGSKGQEKRTGDEGTSRLSAEETAAWMDFFGDIPEVAELGNAAIDPPSIAKAAPPPAAKKPAPKPKDEIAEWLEVFGAVPQNELQQDRELKKKLNVSQSDVDQWIKEFEAEDERSR